MVRPISVTPTSLKPRHEPDFNVITMLETRLAFENATISPPITTSGTTPEAKNPFGYIKVTVSGAVRAPAALGTKLNVTETPFVLMIRSLPEIAKETAVTAPPTYPDCALDDTS
jgi:hypothetical protein